MRRQIERFICCEEGAVTVDWVVLCAGLVAMAAIISSQMQTGTVSAANQTSTYMQSLR